MYVVSYPYLHILYYVYIFYQNELFTGFLQIQARVILYLPRFIRYVPIGGIYDIWCPYPPKIQQKVFELI